MSVVVPRSIDRATARLTQIDGLRAIAALTVVLYHYTSRYDAIFVHVPAMQWSVPLGSMGVRLLFVVSGFVMFMTLDAARKPLDFVVFRLARLGAGGDWFRSLRSRDRLVSCGRL